MKSGKTFRFCFLNFNVFMNNFNICVCTLIFFFACHQIRVLGTFSLNYICTRVYFKRDFFKNNPSMDEQFPPEISAPVQSHKTWAFSPNNLPLPRPRFIDPKNMTCWAKPADVSRFWWRRFFSAVVWFAGNPRCFT